ncbi:hypothetical protein D5S10_29070 [Pseudomonas savastanoi]|nr:hypothetical protein D5S10_29070 [Pseudomonas savastanoi]
MASVLLPEGRGSELVREKVFIIAENASTETAPSRASSLPRPAARIKNGLMYDAERGNNNWHRAQPLNATTAPASHSPSSATCCLRRS